VRVLYECVWVHACVCFVRMCVSACFVRMCVCVSVFCTYVSWSLSWIYFCWSHASLPLRDVDVRLERVLARKEKPKRSSSLSLSHPLSFFFSTFLHLSIYLSRYLSIYLSIYLSCFLASIQDHAHSFDTVKPCLTSRLCKMSRSKKKLSQALSILFLQTSFDTEGWNMDGYRNLDSKTNR
jgi:hypothetical protein